MKTPTEKLVTALHTLANDIQSNDGVANAAIQEAALRLEEQEARITRLEKAGNQLKDRYILENEKWDLQTVNDWNDAKEVKP